MTFLAGTNKQTSEYSKQNQFPSLLHTGDEAALPGHAEKINSPSALLSQRVLKKGMKINREKEGGRDK